MLTIAEGADVCGAGQEPLIQEVGRTLAGPQGHAGTWSGHTEDGRGQ